MYNVQGRLTVLCYVMLYYDCYLSNPTSVQNEIGHNRNNMSNVHKIAEEEQGYRLEVSN